MKIKNQGKSRITINRSKVSHAKIEDDKKTVLPQPSDVYVRDKDGDLVLTRSGYSEDPKEKQRVLKKLTETVADVTDVGNTALATDWAGQVAGWFADKFNKNSNVYDKAIDAVYNQTHVGGSSLHHIVDGQHTFWGAFKAAHDALPDDKLSQEIGGAAEHLARDMCSKSGINPVLNMDIETYRTISSYFKDTFGVSKHWFSDMLTFNAPEAAGAGLATIPLVLGWNKLGVEKLSEMSSSLGIAASVSANPLLGIVTLVSAGRAISKMGREKKPLRKSLKGLIQGVLLTGVAVGVSSAVGGPVLPGLVVGLAAGITAKFGFNKAWQKVSGLMGKKKTAKKRNSQAN